MAYTFADLFEHSVDVMPDRLALIVSGEEVTYRELDERANRLAHYFQSVGLGVGSHIGIQLHNSIEAMVAVLAAFKIRGVPITVNYRYTSDELVYLYENADLTALVFHRGFAERVAEALVATPRVKYVIEAADELALGNEPSIPGQWRTRMRSATNPRFAQVNMHFPSVPAMTSTFSTPAEQPDDRKASSGGRKTSGAYWPAVTTSIRVSRSPTSTSSRAVAPRQPNRCGGACFHR